jgi:hypothetical protein
MWYRFSHPLRTLAIAALLVLAVACGSNDSGSEVLVETSTGPSNGQIHLVDALDDPGHYCIDVAGFGASARIQDALQAHTCKPTDNSDQTFTLRLPDGQLYMEEYNLCLQPEDLAPGSGLFL